MLLAIYIGNTTNGATMRTFTLVNKTSLSIEGIQDLINESVLAYMPETDEDYANGINVAEGMCHVEFEVVKVDEQSGLSRSTCRH